ncbi:MAG: hypothetical protein JW738_03135 [Actinobacteria bacterium]|nr:hypothetical protein [Actinomycetota bacterium]
MIKDIVIRQRFKQCVTSGKHQFGAHRWTGVPFRTGEVKPKSNAAVAI